MKIKLSMSLAFLLAYANINAHDLLTSENFAEASAPDYTFGMNFTTMFLKPSSDLDYAAEAFPLPLPSPDWQIHTIQTHYNFAFDLGARVILHKKNSIIMGDWEHFSSSDTAPSCSVALSTNMVGPFFEIGPDAAAYTNYGGAAQYQLDRLNIDYGQLIEIGQNLTANLFTGINFSRLRQNIFMHYANNAGIITRDITTTTSFSGIGPQFGIELGYKIHKGLNFVGYIIGDMLTGTMKSNTIYTALNPANQNIGNTNPNVQTTSIPNSLQVIPVFSQRIGISYEYLFRDHCAVHAEIGYQAQIYINAINSVTLGSEVNTPPVTPDTIGVFARTFHKNSNDFALSGPYFKIDIAF